MHKILLYIDPGTGSLIIQVLVASIITVSLFFKRIWKRFFNLFKRNKTDKSEEN